MFLNCDNSVDINAQIKRTEGKDNVFSLCFFNTESQSEFYEEIGIVKDEEI